MPKSLTISMATYDDYDGVYFTIQALRLYHWLPAQTEFIILDNNPTSDHGRALAKFADGLEGVRVIEVTDRRSSFIKYDIAKHAQGDVILGLDCHVLLQPGFIDHMMTYWDYNPDSRNMLTGPLLYNGLTNTSVKMLPQWRGDDFGCWGDDKKAMSEGLPFEVEMQGMGCFSFLRKHFPEINPAFSGFGAEEWYVAEKTRQNGGKVICHPKLGWNHRFEWPKRSFPLCLEDKVRNYYRGWRELYGSDDHAMMRIMRMHWLTVMPADKLDAIISSLDNEVSAPKPQ
jgi:hypothetical protein